MTRRTDLPLSLGPQEWALLGYLGACVLWWAFGEFGTDGGDSRNQPASGGVRLREEHLQRLEQGRPVTFRRWHGHDLRLDGTLVVDVAGETDADTDADGEQEGGDE